LYTASTRYDLLLYVLILLFFGAYGLLLFLGSLAGGYGDSYLFTYLAMTLAGFALAIAVFPMVRRDKYEFFPTFFRITHKSLPSIDVPYTEIERVGRKYLAGFPLRIKGEKKDRVIPAPRERTAPGLYAWLMTKIPVAK